MSGTRTSRCAAPGASITLALLFALLLAPRVAHAAASVSGLITDAVTERPIARAAVRLKGSDRRDTTDITGRYRLAELEPGVALLAISAPGYETIEREVSLVDGLETALDVKLDIGVTAETEEVTVEAPRPVLQKAPRVSSVTLNTEELRASPGSLEDITRVIQTLPGVVIEGDFAGLMYVRGGGFAQTAFFLDDFIMANPYHFGGVNTVFNPELVEDVTFWAGGFPARYGSVGSGIIDIRYREGTGPRHYMVDLSVITAKAHVEDAVADGEFTYMLSWRRSYFDGILLGMDAAGLIDKDKTAVPAYGDLVGKFTWKPSGRHRIESLLMFADDSVTVGEVEDESRPDAEAGSVDYSNITLLWGIKHHWYFTPQLYLYSVYNGFFERGEGELTGTNPFKAKVSFMLQTARMQLHWLPPRHHIQLGVEAGRGDVDFSGLIRDFSTISAGSNYTGDRNYEPLELDPKKSYPGLFAYVEDEWEILKDRLRVNLGGRVQRFVVGSSTTWAPRASMSLQLNDKTLLKAAYGQYWQEQPSPIIEDDFFNGEALDPLRNTHYILGFERELPAELFLRIEAYHKDEDFLVANYDNQLDALAAKLRGDNLFTNDAYGYSNGLEFFLQRKESASVDWWGWITYAYAVSKRWNPLHRVQPKAYYNRQDQRHTLSVVGAYRLTDKWTLSGKFQLFSGKPITPITGWDIQPDRSDPECDYENDPESCPQVYVPVQGSLNSARLPAYHRLDLRAEMTWVHADWRESIYFEIMNVYNQQNLYSYQYVDGDVEAGKEPEREEVNSLPIIPYFGYRAEF